MINLDVVDDVSETNWLEAQLKSLGQHVVEIGIFGNKPPKTQYTVEDLTARTLRDKGNVEGIHTIATKLQISGRSSLKKAELISAIVATQTKANILIIATVNEYGAEIKVTDKMRGYLAYNGLHLKATTKSIKIPERSFIRKTADTKQKEINNFLTKQYNRLFNMQINAEQFLNALGEFCVGITKKTLVDVNSPPNHPYTVQQKKGKTNPLVNTGSLVSRIGFEVKKK